MELLVEEGHEVSIATRGNSPHPFGSRVKRIVVDRTDKEALQKAMQNTQWDIVYDNICFSPNEAMAACDILKENKKIYFYFHDVNLYRLRCRVEGRGI